MLKRAFSFLMVTLFLISTVTVAFNIQPVKAEMGLAESPWPMFGCDPQHTRRSPYRGAQTNELKWLYATGGSVYSSPSTGPDSTIYVGSYDGKLYAINPDGTFKWSYVIGSAIDSSPAIDVNGNIYVGCADSKLYAMNSDGSQKWTYATGGSIESSPGIGPDGTIYVGSSDDRLYAINPGGAFKWSYKTGGDIIGDPALSPDGFIYVGSIDKNLYAFNSDGTFKWSFTTGGSIYHSAPAIGSDGTIYVGSGDYSLYAIKPDGTLRWSYRTGYFIASSPGLGSDGTIYIGSYDNSLYAIKPDGTLKWRFTTGDDIISSPAIGLDGTIYIGSKDGIFYAINPNGTLKWSYTTGGRIYSSPSIDSDGTVYVGSSDYNLYAFGTSEQPQLKAPWVGVARITQGNNGATSHHDYGTWDNTYAIDVSLPVGSIILAPADGVVKYVDNDASGAGGKELALEHTGPTGKKFVTVYLHLNEILVTTGSPVKQGQTVAKSGATGTVTGPHLHFHMWKPKGSEPEWSYDSHTMPIERLVMKQIGVDNDFREYDARKGELNDDKIAGKLFGSNNTPSSADDMYWLAKAIMSEASVGTTEERVAVGWTVLNRFDNGGFGSSIEGIVKRGYAYNQEPTENIMALAEDLLERKIPDPTEGATYFFSPRGMPKEGDDTTGFDIGGGLQQVPLDGQEIIKYFPSFAKPEEGTAITETTTRYLTTKPIPTKLEWRNLANIRNWYFMFYRPYTTQIHVERKSPVEVWVYDSQGQVTGLVNGTVVIGIPRSDYFENTVTIFFPNDTYRCVAVGVTEGLYGLVVTAVTREENITFSATNIPTSAGAAHQCSIDWDVLSRGQEGVTVEVDSNGDGVFEHTFTSDSELTQNEFLIQTGQSALYTFSIVWGEETFIVSAESNSTVSNFAFNQPDKTIIFDVTGSADTIGFCNVTIPKALLHAAPSDWTVLIDGASVPLTMTENATHSCLYFTYAHSTHEVQIIGTVVIGPLPTYSLTITTTAGGTVDPLPGIYTHTASSSVQVTAMPSEGYSFDHWELDTINVGSANPYTVMMDGNHTLKAVFVYSNPQYVVGDVNKDGIVDIFDLVRVVIAFGGGDTRCDLNGDGAIDIFDLATVAMNFGRESTPP